MTDFIRFIATVYRYRMKGYGALSNHEVWIHHHPHPSLHKESRKTATCDLSRRKSTHRPRLAVHRALVGGLTCSVVNSGIS